MRCKAGDRITVGQPLGDGTHACLRHYPDHRLEVARCRPVRSGENLNGSRVIMGQVVSPNVLDVETELDLRGGASGPPQVATDAYRDGWDRIFGSATVGQA